MADKLQKYNRVIFGDRGANESYLPSGRWFDYLVEWLNSVANVEQLNEFNIFPTETELNDYLTNPDKKPGQMATVANNPGHIYTLNSDATAWVDLYAAVIQGRVDYYDNLPDATLHANEIWIVENATLQYVFFTKYSAGIYISNGVTWVYIPNNLKADFVNYVNTTSGLAATNVQDAIDEIVGDIPDISGLLKLDQTTKQTLTGSPIIDSLVAGRIPFVNTDKSLTDDIKLRWDNTNKRLLLGETYTPISASYDMKLGITVDTTLISGLDFKNLNPAGQVRFLARNDVNDSLIITTYGSNSATTIMGYSAKDCSAILLNPTTDTDKKLLIGSGFPGELVFGTNNQAKAIIGGTNSNFKLISNSLTTGSVLDFGLVMTTNATTTPTIGIRGIRGSSVATSTLSLYTNSINRVNIKDTGEVGIGKIATEKLDVEGNIKASGSIQVGNNTDTASSSNEGAIRYRTDSNASYIDMCMQTGSGVFSWVNIITNTW